MCSRAGAHRWCFAHAPRSAPINHTLLSVEAIRARDIPLLGIAFIGDEHADSEQIITAMARTRRLGRLPLLPLLTAESLRTAFAAHFNVKEFLEGAA